MGASSHSWDTTPSARVAVKFLSSPTPPYPLVAMPRAVVLKEPPQGEHFLERCAMELNKPKPGEKTFPIVTEFFEGWKQAIPGPVRTLSLL